MSYCRWSDDSDVYCYADSMGGYTTHVAGRKLKPGAVYYEPTSHENTDEYIKRIDTLYEPIGLPYDGEFFNDPDLGSFLDRLLELRAAGYNVPEYAVERVREELDEEV